MSIKLLKTLGLAAVLVLVAGAAMASNVTGADNDAFDIVVFKGQKLFMEIRTVVFVLGGFGLVALAVASIFGRPLWKWFGALALGLIVIAVAGALVNYFVTKEGTSNEVDFNDTMWQ